MTVIALADNGVRQRIENARGRRTSPFIEIPRILLEQRWQDGPTDHVADKTVGIRRAKSLGISLRALSITVEAVIGLLYARDHPARPESDRVDRALPGKLELLPRSKWERILTVGDIEIRKHAQHPLRLLHLDLFFRQLEIADPDLHFGGGGSDRQGDLGHLKHFPCTKDSRLFLGSKARRGNRDLKGTRRDAGKDKTSLLVGRHFLLVGLPFAHQPHPGGKNEVSVRVDDRAADST